MALRARSVCTLREHLPESRCSPSSTRGPSPASLAGVSHSAAISQVEIAECTHVCATLWECEYLCMCVVVRLSVIMSVNVCYHMGVCACTCAGVILGPRACVPVWDCGCAYEQVYGHEGVNMHWCGDRSVCERLCWCAVVSEKGSVHCACTRECVRWYGHLQLVQVCVLVFGSGSERVEVCECIYHLCRRQSSVCTCNMCT